MNTHAFSAHYLVDTVEVVEHLFSQFFSLKRRSVFGSLKKKEERD